jgi:hypothetical protein
MKFSTVCSFMRHPIHEIWHDTYFDIIEEWRQRYGNGHLEIRKMKIKKAHLFNGAAEGNIYRKPGMSHYIPCLIAE